MMGIAVEVAIAVERQPSNESILWHFTNQYSAAQMWGPPAGFRSAADAHAEQLHRSRKGLLRKLKWSAPLVDDARQEGTDGVIFGVKVQIPKFFLAGPKTKWCPRSENGRGAGDETVRLRLSAGKSPAKPKAVVGKMIDAARAASCAQGREIDRRIKARWICRLAWETGWMARRKTSRCPKLYIVELALRGGLAKQRP